MNKLLLNEEVAQLTKKFKKNKKIVAMLHGVFDVLHVGHIRYFEDIKRKADKLIISLTDDEFVNKGPGRPLFKIKERVEMLSKIDLVDFITISKSETAEKIIKIVKPNIYAKGNDYKNKKNDITKNIYKEINAVKSIGGKFVTSNTPMYSSTKIINNDTDYLSDSLKEYLKDISSDKLKNKFSLFLKNKINKKILVLGEPIIDIYNYVQIQGKSSKNNILSSKHISASIFGGGTILVANILKEFSNKIDFVTFENNYNNKYIKKFLDKKKINIKKIFSKDYKYIVKKRFIDKYSKNRLYQINYNDEHSINNKAGSKLNEYLKKNHKKYDHIIVFDFGHNLINSEVIKTLNKINKKIFINCQSNSSNFGFNLVNKYLAADTISMDEQEFRLSVQDKNKPIKDLIRSNKNFIKKFKNFIVTMGKNGSYHISKNSTLFSPTIYSTFKDTTGSGDVFFSIYIALKISKKFSNKEICLICHMAAGLHANKIGNDKIFDIRSLYKALDLILK